MTVVYHGIIESEAPAAWSTTLSAVLAQVDETMHLSSKQVRLVLDGDPLNVTYVATCDFRLCFCGQC